MKYLTIDAVCEMLSISRRTLERLRRPKENPKKSSKFMPQERPNISTILYGTATFPEPDLYIGRSPRWEHDKLIKWLQENGSRLQT
jgi:hypothetical protein